MLHCTGSTRWGWGCHSTCCCNWQIAFLKQKGKWDLVEEGLFITSCHPLAASLLPTKLERTSQAELCQQTLTYKLLTASNYINFTTGSSKKCSFLGNWHNFLTNDHSNKEYFWVLNTSKLLLGVQHVSFICLHVSKTCQTFHFQKL